MPSSCLASYFRWANSSCFHLDCILRDVFIILLLLGSVSFHVVFMSVHLWFNLSITWRLFAYGSIDYRGAKVMDPGILDARNNDLLSWPGVKWNILRADFKTPKLSKSGTLLRISQLLTLHIDSMKNIKYIYNSFFIKKSPFYCFSCFVVHVLSSGDEQDYPL